MSKKKRQLSPFEQKMNLFVAKHLTTVPFVQKMFFIDHLQTMIHAGLSLMEGLQVLQKETTNQKLKLVIQDVIDDVAEGSQLSDALKKHPRIFPQMYTKMIRAGEVSGQLEGALKQVASQMKRAKELSSSIRGAMIYPAVIIIAMGGVGIMMTTIVLPRLIGIFSEFDTELPLATRVLIAVTEFMSNPFYLTLSIAGFIGAIVLYIAALKRSSGFRFFMHGITLKLPIAGKIVKKINLAKFSMTLSSLLTSTVPIIQSTRITADTCSNVRYRAALREAADGMKDGTQLSTLLANHDELFPPMVTEMVLVGERSGAMTDLLENLAEFYSKEVDTIMQNFAKIIEPVIIILIGIAVAGLAVAVIMPMYSLVQTF